MFDGVRFQVFSHDHAPAHAHGSYGSMVMVVELVAHGTVRVRRGSMQPTNAKRRDVKKVLNTARANYDYLVDLWEKTHGKAGR